jgi:hypothetical protein
MPEAKSYKKLNYKCISCDNFIINVHDREGLENVGLCQLFSYRQFNGEEKNACSKFVKRREQAIG